MFVYAKNTSGAIITNGTPVYISGASGANIEIAKALASSQDNCRKTIAVATEDIGINEFGYVTTFGFVRDINTNGFIEGGEVFVGVSGGYTQTKPALPNCIVKIGICARANTSNGIILVNVDVKSTKDIQVDSGDLTVYTEANKTLVLQQQCYRDEYPTPLVPAGGAAGPDQVTYTIGGVSTTRYSFDGNTTEERISGSFEIPHDYKTGESGAVRGFGILRQVSLNVVRGGAWEQAYLRSILSVSSSGRSRSAVLRNISAGQT